MIDDKINAISKQQYSWIGKPASPEELELCNKRLVEKGMPVLPPGYADFLKKCNGFYWNEQNFYGTKEVTNPHSKDVVEDIISINEDFVKYNQCHKHCLFLGLGWNCDYFNVYNTINKRYEVLDSEDHSVKKDYGTFEEMFCDLVSE